MNKPFQITPVYDQLLRGSVSMPVGLYHLHMATAAQLCRLHYRAGTLTTVKARLKTLSDQGFVVADSVPTRLFRSPYFYTLGNAGMRYLADIGLDVAPSLRARKEVSKHYLYVNHALELGDVLIAALRLKFADPHYYLARFIHERTLKRTPYKAAENGRSVSLIPDAFLDFRKCRPGQTDLSLPLILEHDRGTEQQHHFKQRIGAYKAFLRTRMYHQLFGVETITVAFTTFAGARRVAQMREWTRAELTDDAPLARVFLFADLPQPLEPHHLLFERRWLTLASNQPIALLKG